MTLSSLDMCPFPHTLHYLAVPNAVCVCVFKSLSVRVGVRALLPGKCRAHFLLRKLLGLRERRQSAHLQSTSATHSRQHRHNTDPIQYISRTRPASLIIQTMTAHTALLHTRNPQSSSHRTEKRQQWIIVALLWMETDGIGGIK